MDNFLQSPAWASFNRELGATVVEDGLLLYLQRTFRFGKYYLCSRCSIPSNFMLPNLDKNTCFIRLEPQDGDAFHNLEEFARRHQYQLLSTHAIQPRQTVIVDITRSEEEIIQSMKSKHRYNLRLSERHALHFEVHSTFQEEAFTRFWALLSATATRQGFRTHPQEYYRKMFRVLAEKNMAHVIIVRSEQTDLAAMLLITYGDTATYLHGASHPEHRQLMAPYLMHWQAIKLAKEQGCKYYDLWGSDLVQDEITGEWKPKDSEASYGTSRFKAGFGGNVIEYPGTYDLILNPFCYTLYKTVRSLKGGKRAFH